MTEQTYKNLATAWVPDDRETRVFYGITAVVLAVVLGIAIAISLVALPPKERKARQPVPERVAKFITQKKREAPKPKPVVIPTPKPIITPKPKVVRKKETEAEKKKPLTKIEKKAREKAASSGLLALGNEIADLMDTSDVDDLVGGKIKKSSDAAQQVAGVDTDVLTRGASAGSGGVSTSDYVGQVGSTKLSQRDIALVKQSLLKSDQLDARETASENSGARSGKVRTEEEVTIVFDQNKGQLFSIYNRERRKKPGLKGKIVLEITIAADGKVTNVSIASSELNDPALERRLVARVKLFKFEPKDVEPVTVTFPIEFLPS